MPLVQSRAKKWSFEKPPMKKHYMRHRFGELTIIVLGEFFIKVITSASDRDIYLVTMLYFILLFAHIYQPMVALFRPPGTFSTGETTITHGDMDLHPLSFIGSHYRLRSCRQ